MSAQLRSPGAVLIAWIVAGALTLIGALVCAELASAFPRTGGVYVYLGEAFGPLAGFLWGWAMLWVMHSGIVAAIAVGCARYVGHFVALDVAGTRAVAITAVLALTIVNFLGVKLGGAVQTWLTIVKVTAVVGLVILLFAAGPATRSGAPLLPAASLPATAGAAAVPFTSLLLAVGAGLFAFGGWHMVTYAAGETVDPERTIPRALLLGAVIVTLCYVALNAAYFHVLPIADIARSRSVAADAASAALGAGAGDVVAAIVVVSTLGALNGVVLAGPRVYFAMAGGGLLPRWLGAVHPAFRTPHRALLIQGVWAALLVATGSYEALFGRVIYTEWLFFAALALGLLALRRRAAYRPAWRLPAAPVATVLFAAASLAVAINQMVSRPRDSAIGLLLVASGIPVYFMWVRRSRQPTREESVS
jgi:APA family basic amino acid/polyamine antiporter